MYKITKKFSFDSAHQLHDKMLSNEENEKIFGKCHSLHGHSYFVIITVACHYLKNGMVENFTDIKKVYTEKIHNKYDHKFLNDLMPFLTTAENLAEHFYDILKVDFPLLESVEVFETPTSSAIFTKS